MLLRRPYKDKTDMELISLYTHYSNIAKNYVGQNAYEVRKHSIDKRKQLDREMAKRGWYMTSHLRATAGVRPKNQGAKCEIHSCLNYTKSRHDVYCKSCTNVLNGNIYE